MSAVRSLSEANQTLCRQSISVANDPIPTSSVLLRLEAAYADPVGESAVE
jgi:hypothetical protein